MSVFVYEQNIIKLYFEFILKGRFPFLQLMKLKYKNEMQFFLYIGKQ